MIFIQLMTELVTRHDASDSGEFDTLALLNFILTHYKSV